MYTEMFYDSGWQEYRSRLHSDKIPNDFYILTDREDMWRWYSTQCYAVHGEPKRSGAIALKDLLSNLTAIKRKVHNEITIDVLELRKTI